MIGSIGFGPVVLSEDYCIFFSEKTRNSGEYYCAGLGSVKAWSGDVGIPRPWARRDRFLTALLCRVWFQRRW